MPSIILLAIGVAIATTLLGSILLESLMPAVLSPLEQKCQKIANDGYKIHTKYPNLNFDELPENDMIQLMYLDEIWINECVSALPADSVFSIVNDVERISHGE